MLCIIVQNEEDIAAFKDFSPSEDIIKPKAEETSTSSSPPPPSPPKAAAPSPPQASPGFGGASSGAPGGRIFASPFAKALAASKGIELSAVGQGSGPGGRIIGQDIASASPMASASAPVSDAPYVDLPLSGMRQTIAKRLLQSKQSIPHYYLSVDIEMDQVLR